MRYGLWCGDERIGPLASLKTMGGAPMFVKAVVRIDPNVGSALDDLRALKTELEAAKQADARHEARKVRIFEARPEPATDADRAELVLSLVEGLVVIWKFAPLTGEERLGMYEADFEFSGARLFDVETVEVRQ